MTSLLCSFQYLGLGNMASCSSMPAPFLTFIMRAKGTTDCAYCSPPFACPEEGYWNRRDFGEVAFAIGSDFVMDLGKLEEVLGAVESHVMDDPEWRRCFGSAFRQGLAAEFRERNWRTAEMHYLDCWKLLQDAEERFQIAVAKPLRGLYAFFCTSVGVRLICIYQHFLRDFPKCLAVTTWLHRLLPLCCGLLLHKAQVLFQWSWVEELAGNLVYAHHLKNLAVKLTQGSFPQPFWQNLPQPLRQNPCVIFSATLAYTASRYLRSGEARLWIRKGLEYSRDHCEQLHLNKLLQFITNHNKHCTCGPSWCTCSSSNVDQSLYLISPTKATPHWPIKLDPDAGYFYTNSIVPHIESTPPRLNLCACTPGWQAQLKVCYEAGRAAEAESEWGKAILSYVACKQMILEHCAGANGILGEYKWQAMLIGTRLANLYQCKLFQYEDCVAVLDWLLELVEPHHVCPQLLMHRGQVLYQIMRSTCDQLGEDTKRAAEMDINIIKLKEVITVAVPPVPDLSVFFRMGLAESFPNDALKWLDEVFIESNRWHFQWRVYLGWLRVGILERLRDFKEARNIALELKEMLENTEVTEEEVEVCWFVLVSCYITVLDAAFFLMEDPLNDFVGLQWANAEKLESDIHTTINNLEANVNKSLPLWCPSSSPTVDTLPSLNHIFGLAVHGGPYLIGVMTYRKYRSLAEAIGRGLSKSEAVQSDFEKQIFYLGQEILCANQLLELTGNDQGWHWLTGLSYTKLGQLYLKAVRCDRSEVLYPLLKRNFEAARDHLFKVRDDYTLDTSLTTLRGFSYLSLSGGPWSLMEDRFLALTGVAETQGFRVLCFLNRGYCTTPGEQHDCHSEIQMFFDAMKEAENYCFLPKNLYMQLTTFSDDMLIKLIERREKYASIQSAWSKLLNMRYFLVLAFQNAENYRFALLLDRLTYVEEHLNMLYAFQLLRFYSNEKPAYHDRVLKCWVNATLKLVSTGNDALFQTILDCHQGLCETESVLIVFYEVRAGRCISIYVVAAEPIDMNNSKTVIHGYESYPENDVGAMLRNFHANIASENPDEHKTEELLMGLYEILIQPISHYFKAETCVNGKFIIIAEQILARVPFAILMNPQTKEYLFQRLTVAVVPSCLTLWHCMQRYADLKRDDEEERTNLEPALAAADPAYGRALNKRRLPHSKEEIETVAEIFKESMVQVVKKVGIEANVNTLLEAAAGRRGFIHMAVHAGTEKKKLPANPGVHQFDSIKEGVLYLADPRVKEWPMKRTRNRASMHSEGIDSSEWQLKADTHILQRAVIWNTNMVVLSACSSSSGQVLQSGAYLNLPRALTLAGVPCVVAAQWPIEDACSTPTLMKYFYQGMKAGLDASTALQQSMMKMLTDGEYKVSQWGAFMVWGLPTVRLPGAMIKNIAQL